MTHKLKITGKTGNEQIFLDGKRIFPTAIDISLKATSRAKVTFCFEMSLPEIDFETSDGEINVKCKPLGEAP